ncbi:MAG: antibiotic biosynthesis monooxygenase [Puia sp.]|nr:antibiotic biosynthesis monooxygenase [Puia sp.]
MYTIAQTPLPPYFAVIFTSLRTEGDHGYSAMADEMEALAALQPGYLGFESARDGLGISISYWDSPEAIRNWKRNLDHRDAQQKGRDHWYSAYKIRVCKIERDYEFSRDA